MSFAMKVIFLLVAVCWFSGFGVASGEYCFGTTKLACGNETTRGVNCTAQYGQAHHYIRDLQEYANIHITRNFQYLLMSSHFGNYKKNRDGFKKLYRKLSDDVWEDAIDLIKYITLRGGKMDFHYDEDLSVTSKGPIAMTELESLAKSVDMQKQLALKAHGLYRATHKHDPEVSSYLEDKFMHRHAKTVRDLAGYTIDLSRLVEGEKDSSAVGLKLFVLDSYLKKVL